LNAAFNFLVSKAHNMSGRCNPYHALQQVYLIESFLFAHAVFTTKINTPLDQ
jgi:hypothetical protein